MSMFIILVIIFICDFANKMTYCRQNIWLEYFRVFTRDLHGMNLQDCEK